MCFFFQVFRLGQEQLLSRTWLVDPAETQLLVASGSSRTKQPWNGEFYVSFGHGPERDWEEAQKFGFISAGGGNWYTRTLKLLKVGDRIWVNIPSEGYVGVGRVKGLRTGAADFTVIVDGKEVPALDGLQAGHYHRSLAGNPDEAEYFVPVTWIQTVPFQQRYSESGLFGNQNTVCQPTVEKWRHTVERLKKWFPKWDQTASG
jgi:hypothetical protein